VHHRDGRSGRQKAESWSSSIETSTLQDLDRPFKVLSVDIDHSRVGGSDPGISYMTADSASPDVAAKIAALRQEYPGPIFAIIESDHSKKHVLAETGSSPLRPRPVRSHHRILSPASQRL